METMKMLALAKVIELGSLTKASEYLNYSQPAISRMIFSLEDEFGMSLLIRSSVGTFPTTNALKLLPTLKQIIELEQSLHDDVIQINNMLRYKSLSIGSYVSISQEWMEPVLPQLLAEYPNMELHWLEGFYNELEQWLLTGRIDIALMATPSNQELAFLPLHADEIMLMLPEGHPLGEKEIVEPSEIFEYPFIFPDKGGDEDISPILINYRIKVEPQYYSKGYATIIKMVSMGLGTTILPKLFEHQLPQGVIMRSLKGHPYRDLGIATLKNAKPSLIQQRFVELLSAQLEGERPG